MLIGIDSVLDWVESNNGAYWEIKSGGGEKANLISTSGEKDKQSSTQDSVERLKKELSRLASGNYFIVAWPTLGQTKSRLSVPFQINSSNPAAATPAISGVSAESVADQIRRALEEERSRVRIEQMEKELLELKRKNRELEKDGNDTFTRIAGRLIDVMDAAGVKFGNGTAPNTAPATNTALSGESEEQHAERIGSMLEEWAKTDPNFEQALQGIVNLAKTNPQKYAMGKNLLK